MQRLVLLVNQHLRVADDVDEKDVRELDLQWLLFVAGHESVETIRRRHSLAISKAFVETKQKNRFLFSRAAYVLPITVFRLKRSNDLGKTRITAQVIPVRHE